MTNYLLLFRRSYPRLGLGGCSGDTGEGLSTGGGGMMYGGMKAFSPGQGDTAMMQSRSIGAAATAPSMICVSASPFARNFLSNRLFEIFGVSPHRTRRSNRCYDDPVREIGPCSHCSSHDRADRAWIRTHDDRTERREKLLLRRVVHGWVLCGEPTR